MQLEAAGNGRATGCGAPHWRRLPLPGCSRRRPDVGPQVLRGPARRPGGPLHSDLQLRFAIGAVLSLRLQGQGVKGRLFCMDKPGLTVDDLMLGEIVARQVAVRMDHF